MASDYEAIHERNRQRYGTEIDRIGQMLLADRYDDRTHFIFELLQNAEDALGRRGAWTGQRRVEFKLTADSLVLSHFGQPFNEADVRGVCGIAESTKDQTSIGRFGIGFKSVYTFTKRPEVHSGVEDFAIEGFVRPVRLPVRQRHADETQIVLPLLPEDESAQGEIAEGLQRLGAGALLFLRHINEINWSVEGGASGMYLRSPPEVLGPGVQRVTVLGQETGQDEVDENWLVFHRDVAAPDGKVIGRVEVAFFLEAVEDEPGRWAVQPLDSSPLVVFFPTVVTTHLGILVQGPYRTTPSRDNIPRADAWNQHLVKETAVLLVEAIRWLRDGEMLDTAALRSLPLDRAKFAEGSMFAPLFDAVRQAFLGERLLPGLGGEYVAAGGAKLARSAALRDLFTPAQVSTLFDEPVEDWLAGDITADRTPELHRYLIQQLDIKELTPELVVPRLGREFLEAQADEWIVGLYEFLSGQKAMRRQIEAMPLIRLEDGKHVLPRDKGKASAFLPSAIETGFQTVRRSVCSTPDARSFLISLGITEPDPVDDVILNLLPKYPKDQVDVEDDEYAADIERIRSAYGTDSKTQREKLVAALRETQFVMVIDTGDGEGYVSTPDDVYIATDRLKQLFDGVAGVFVVDDAYDCLRGEAMRELLEACGALRCPRPIPNPQTLSWDERKELRRQAGKLETSGINDRVDDWVLRGFDELLALLPSLSPEQRVERARLIWESLGDLEDRRGRGTFDGLYSWSHYGNYKKEFPAAFIRQLTAESWVPGANGELFPPGLVVFETLGWRANPFLLSKIAFKPPIIDQLAKEAGIDPAALDLLRKYGITTVADLTARLGIGDPPAEGDAAPGEATLEYGPSDEQPDETGSPDANSCGDAKDLYGDDMPDIPPGRPDPDGGDVDHPGGAAGGGRKRGGAGGGTGGTGAPGSGTRTGGAGHGGGTSKGAATGTGATSKTSSKPDQPRHFVSYVGTELDDEVERDPDGLDQATRMEVEDQAIALIIEHEPALCRTKAGNPGFDLYEVDAAGKEVRWVEVKSMTGTLDDRPVGMSRTQFEFAQQRGASYWLYVVENATMPEMTRVLRIQDPANLARTFTFDKGWQAVATELPGQAEL